MTLEGEVNLNLMTGHDLQLKSTSETRLVLPIRPRPIVGWRSSKIIRPLVRVGT